MLVSFHPELCEPRELQIRMVASHPFPTQLLPILSWPWDLGGRYEYEGLLVAVTLTVPKAKRRDASKRHIANRDLHTPLHK
jgi:hypothetical protein